MANYYNDYNEETVKYFKDIKDYDPLTKAEEKELFKKIKEGDLEARNKVLTANLKFVIDVAKKYKGFGVPFADLISEGNMGLIRAIDKFDTNFDVKFYCYAVWWIRQAMQSCIQNRQAITNIEIKDNENAKSYNDMSDDAFEDESDGYLSESDDYADGTDIFTDNYDSYVVEELMKKLDDRERYIVSEYFGFENKPKNLEYIGKKLNISKERVRQIKSQALRKLRCEVLMDETYATCIYS